MSTETSGKGARKKVNLSTAKVADGEVKSPTSVYEILGISTHGYKTNNLDTYSRDIKAMNLMQLQEEAYERAIIATENRDILIDRLEKKFIQETSKFKAASSKLTDKKEEPKEESLKDQATRILARGR